MKYRDRQGREYEQTTSQDSFLAAAYSSAMGTWFADTYIVVSGPVRVVCYGRPR